MDIYVYIHVTIQETEARDHRFVRELIHAGVCGGGYDKWEEREREKDVITDHFNFGDIIYLQYFSISFIPF